MGQTHIFGDLSATVNMMAKCCRGPVNVLPPTGQIVAVAAAETDLTRSVRDGVCGFITSSGENCSYVVGRRAKPFAAAGVL